MAVLVRRLPTERIRWRAYAALLIAEVCEAYQLVGVTPAVLTTTDAGSRPCGPEREYALEARTVLARAYRRTGAPLEEVGRVLGSRRGAHGSYYTRRPLEPEALEILEALTPWRPDHWAVSPCPSGPCEACGHLGGIAERAS